MLFTDFVKYITVRKGAIHVGAHEGQERTFYALRGFEPVMWFEPNKTLFDRLEKNIEGYTNNTAFNIGVHDELQTAELHISSNDGQSSSILQMHRHAELYPKIKYIEDQSIKLIRLDTFFEDNKISFEDYNFLNIDVQGVELNVIKSLGENVRKLDYIYTEINDEELYKDCCLVCDIDAYLKQYNFVRVATHMTHKHWGDGFYIKKQLL
jgi:FkbM family methyltransferase